MTSSTKSDTLYVGLACSFHDPALAIIDARGEVLYAEAAERHLQTKRAFNAPPDDFHEAPRLIRSLGVPCSRVVLAKTWARAYGPQELLWLIRGKTSSFQVLRWLVPTHNAAVNLAGINLAHQIRGPLAVGGRDRVAWRSYPHHLTHAATGAFTSPFERAAVAVIDGAGERSSTDFYVYSAPDLKAVTSTGSVNSLGLFYALLCTWCGWDPFKGEEWKVMGLAAHGHVDPDLQRRMLNLIAVKGLRIVYPTGRREHQTILRQFESLARPPEAPPLSAANLAATGQSVFQLIMLELLRNLHRETRQDNLILSGGCALNSACNGRIMEETPFKQVHVPMAPADDGNALGAAFLALRDESPYWRPSGVVHSPYLGSSIPESAVARVRAHSPVRTSPNVCREVASFLASGRVVAWVQGRAEFGPRALGHRSILADPRSATMRDRLNSVVKFREEFRPLAPAILDEHGHDWFEGYRTSPYMSMAFRFRPERSRLVPAVVHVDGTGRAQSVTRTLEPHLHQLLTEFLALTGVPILINTSLNVMGKPIVHSIEDILGVYWTSSIDVLVVGDVVLEKQARGEYGGREPPTHDTSPRHTSNSLELI